MKKKSYLFTVTLGDCKWSPDEKFLLDGFARSLAAAVEKEAVRIIQYGGKKCPK